MCFKTISKEEYNDYIQKRKNLDKDYEKNIIKQYEIDGEKYEKLKERMRDNSKKYYAKNKDSVIERVRNHRETKKLQNLTDKKEESKQEDKKEEEPIKKEDITPKKQEIQKKQNILLDMYKSLYVDGQSTDADAKKKKAYPLNDFPTTRYLNTFRQSLVSMRSKQWEIFSPRWYNLWTQINGERKNDG